MEGSSRTPFIIRWRGKIPAGRVSNEIVHEMDTFTTFAKLAGAPVPQDRLIDGVDQTDFLVGKNSLCAAPTKGVSVRNCLPEINGRFHAVAANVLILQVPDGHGITNVEQGAPNHEVRSEILRISTFPA